MVKMAVGAGTDSNANPGLKRRAKPASGVAPAMLAAPALSGPGLVGASMRVDPGIWSGVPAPVVTSRWRRNGVDIPGAAGVEYTPVAADDGTDLDCVVTASNASGTASAATGTARITWPAPVAAGALADLVLDQGPGARTLDASGAFAGAALVFGVSGAGASVDPATGLVSIPLDAPRAAEPVTVTATNSGGSASVSFTVTVVAAPVLTPPISTIAPSLSGPGRVGTPMLVDTGVWSGDPAPVLSPRWRRNGVEIAGAAGVEYTPVAADEGTDLDCVVTASNASGTASAVTEAVRITWPAPVAAGALADLVLDQGPGARTLDASGAFAGAALVFGVSGAGASVDPATGLVSIPLDAPRAAETVAVTATNSGGAASVSFAVTVVAADTAAPVLAAGALDVAASPATLSVTVGEGGTAFWMVDGAATRDAAEVEAGGGAASGDFEVGSGATTADVDLGALAPGAWTLHLTVRDAAGNRSNVISSTFDLVPSDLTAPVLSGMAVTAGATGATLSVSTDEAGGTLHWMVDAAATRSADEILAGGRRRRRASGQRGGSPAAGGRGRAEPGDGLPVPRPARGRRRQPVGGRLGRVRHGRSVHRGREGRPVGRRGQRLECDLHAKLYRIGLYHRLGSGQGACRHHYRLLRLPQLGAGGHRRLLRRPPNGPGTSSCAGEPPSGLGCDVSSQEPADGSRDSDGVMDRRHHPRRGNNSRGAGGRRSDSSDRRVRYNTRRRDERRVHYDARGGFRPALRNGHQHRGSLRRSLCQFRHRDPACGGYWNRRERRHEFRGRVGRRHRDRFGGAPIHMAVTDRTDCLGVA